MEPVGKRDPFFNAIQCQLRVADLRRRRPAIAPAMVPCHEHRAAGAWQFTRQVQAATWDPHVILASSLGDPSWGYLRSFDVQGRAAGAYRLGRDLWHRAVELVIDIMEARWTSFPPYGTCRTTEWKKSWGRWVSKDDRVQMPLLPSCLLEGDCVPRTAAIEARV